jgi:glutathione S-transferase
MIELYTSSSTNGAKVHIMLEETGLDYEIHHVKLDEGEHKKPDYLAINPNGKIPAIVDRSLANAEYLGGDYSIADISCLPWLRNHHRFSIDIEDFPNVGRWIDKIFARPAVQRGPKIP